MHDRLKNRKPRILIGGIIPGAGNIGDDGITEGVLQILDRSLPEAEVTIGTYRGQKLEHLRAGISYVESLNPNEFRKALRACDLFICGGATLIGDELGLGYPLEYTGRLVSRAKLYGKPVGMLAIGANRLRGEKAIGIGRTILGLADIVTVRDAESHQVCLELGARPDRLAITADPAFLVQPRGSPRTQQLKERLRARGGTFGVNVVNEAWAGKTEYKVSIARACECLHDTHGFVPVFFCSEVRPGDFFDFEANRQTASYLRCEHELLDPVYYTPGEMLDIISSFEFVIAMRMHSLIFSAVAGVPFAAVSRADKVDNFMRLFGLTASGSVDRCDSDKVVANVKTMLQQRDSFLSVASEQLGRLREMCLRNVDLMKSAVDEDRFSGHKVTYASLRLLASEVRPRAVLLRAIHPGVSVARSVRNLIAPKTR